MHTASTIASRTAHLTDPADRAAAYDRLGSEVAAQIATGTLSTSELLDACDLHTWLGHMRGLEARRIG